MPLVWYAFYELLARKHSGASVSQHRSLHGARREGNEGGGELAPLVLGDRRPGVQLATDTDEWRQIIDLNQFMRKKRITEETNIALIYKQ